MTAATPSEILPMRIFPTKKPTLIAINRTIKDCVMSGCRFGENNVLNQSNIISIFDTILYQN